MNKEELIDLYINKGMSASEIAHLQGCSESKINYWLLCHKIPKRSISEAVYKKHNPNGDPFVFGKLNSQKKSFVFGLGLGLFWGEGSKRNVNSVRLSNSDPRLIKWFILFLKEIYSIDKNKLRFQLQIHKDLKEKETIQFWLKFLKVKQDQFFKTTLLKGAGPGSYKQRSQYGVIIVYFNNTKLRNLICDQIANLGNL